MIEALHAATGSQSFAGIAIIATYYQHYFYGGIAIGLAALFGVSIGRLGLEVLAPPVAGKFITTASALLLVVSGAISSVFVVISLTSPGFPWQIDQFGVAQPTISGLLPLTVLIPAFVVAAIIGERGEEANNLGTWVIATILGGLIGGFFTLIGWWGLMGDPLLGSIFEIVGGTVLLVVTPILALLSGIAVGQHGLSDAEQTWFNRIVEDYTGSDAEKSA